MSVFLNSNIYFLNVSMFSLRTRLDGISALKHPFICDLAKTALKYQQSPKLLDERNYEFFDGETFIKDIPGIPVVQMGQEEEAKMQIVDVSMHAQVNDAAIVPAQPIKQKRGPRKHPIVSDAYLSLCKNLF